MIKTSLIVVTIITGCANGPSELNGQRPCDCSSPTYPATITIDSSTEAVVVEIYDYQQDLLLYEEQLDGTIAMKVEREKKLAASEGKHTDELFYYYLAKYGQNPAEDFSAYPKSYGALLGKVTLYFNGEVMYGWRDVGL